MGGTVEEELFVLEFIRLLLPSRITTSTMNVELVGNTYSGEEIYSIW